MKKGDSKTYELFKDQHPKYYRMENLFFSGCYQQGQKNLALLIYTQTQKKKQNRKLLLEKSST